MADYKAYIARSLTDPSNMNGEVGFHLRIAKNAMDNTPPFWDFDPNKSDPVTVVQSQSGNVTNYTVNVWLAETSTPTSLIKEDWIFKIDDPVDYDKLFGKIVMYKIDDEDNETEAETNDDLLYEIMPAEYPIGN